MRAYKLFHYKIIAFREIDFVGLFASEQEDKLDNRT